MEVISSECVFTHTVETKGRALLSGCAQSQACQYAGPCTYATSVNVWKGIQVPSSTCQRMKWSFFFAIISLPWWHLVYQEHSMRARACVSNSLLRETVTHRERPFLNYVHHMCIADGLVDPMCVSVVCQCWRYEGCLAELFTSIPLLLYLPPRLY